MPQWGTSRAHYPAPGCSLVTQTHLPAQLTDGQHHGFHQHDQTASRVPPLALAHPPLPRSPHPGPQRGACQEKRDPGSFHTQAWSSRRKKKTLLSTSSSITNSFDFIMWRWETKPDIWLNWGKKKKKERKRVLSVRDTHLNDWFNRLESLGSWLSRAAANLSFGPGKPSRCSSAGWMQEHNEGLGSDESKDPSQPMLLPQEEHPVTAGHLENAHAGKPELPATPRHKGTGHLQ